MSETEGERWERLSRDRIVRPMPKRFYKVASVTDEFGIALDGRGVKTPLKAKLVLPSRQLAEAIAAEWNAQAEHIDAAKMPLTKLANTAIDRARPERKFVAGQVLEFAGSDMVYYRAETPENLRMRQQVSWDPVVAWASEKMQAQFKFASGVMHQQQKSQTLIAADMYIASLDPFELTVAHNLTTLTGSALIGLMLTAKALSAEAGWTAAHVEEDFQIETWGQDDEAAARRAFRRIDYDGSLKFLDLCTL